MPDGRRTCTCGQPVVDVLLRDSHLRAVCDWPWSPTGDIAIEQTAAGGFVARYLPVGEALRAAEKRFRQHACQPPAPSISEPHVPAQVPAEQVKRWQQAVNEHLADKRRQSSRRPAADVRVGSFRRPVK